MKKSLILCIVTLILYPLSVPAQDVVDRYIDILEPGNPGGWSDSLKTWDAEYSVNVGDTVEFDLWLGDENVEGFVMAGFWAYYDPSQLSMFDVEAYDDMSLAGPWDSELTGIIPDAGGPGTYIVDCAQQDCAQSDSDGHMILARGWIESNACGDAIIGFSDIPQF